MTVPLTVLIAVLSGFVGAVLGIVVTLFVEGTRAKGEAAIAIATWTDQLHTAIQKMHLLKERFYDGGPIGDNQQAYVEASEEVRRLTVTVEYAIRTAVAFGTGREYQLVQEFQGGCLTASRRIRTTTADNWKTELETAYQEMEALDPVRVELHRRMLQGASVPVILARWKRHLFGPPGAFDVSEPPRGSA